MASFAEDRAAFRQEGMAASAPAGQEGRLLVVDDEVVQRLIVSRAAQTAGFAAETASTLPEAVQRVGAAQYDIVVLDLGLRDHDGIELLRTLAESGSDPVLIFISGFDERVRQAAARLAGALGLRVAGTLGKPLPVERLLTLLRSVPARSRTVRLPSADEVGEADLARAVERREIHCVFQPQVLLANRRLVGLEALARWNSPAHGVVPPDMFIPLAERTGLIDPLTHCLLQQALAAFRPWRAELPELTLSVNLSALSLNDLSLPEQVCDLLGQAGVPPSSLVLEVTESAVMAEYVAAADILTRLRIRGVRLSIDDFGTGHSTLLSVLRLPFNELKIDQSFVRNCANDPEAPKVVRAIVSLARELQMQIVAEGIETAASADLMARLGCKVGQGYLFDRPLEAAAVAARIEGQLLQAPS